MCECVCTHESFPSFTSLIRALYVGIGVEPVGRPSTNGLSAVGLKLLILSRGMRHRLVSSVARGVGRAGHGPFRDVVGDVVAHGCRVVADDETCAEAEMTSVVAGNVERDVRIALQRAVSVY